jgi:inhibitor of cysteine peptidase
LQPRHGLSTYSISLTMAVASAVLAACRPAADRPITLTEADSGRTVPVAAGTDIVLALATTPGTGYSWVLTDSGAPALELVDSATVARDSAEAMRPGAPMTATWRFRTTRPGTGTVKLDYRRPWERGVPAARRYDVAIAVR